MSWNTLRAPVLSLLSILSLAPASSAMAQREVVINRVRLSDQTVAGLERRWSVKIQNGQYWYDGMSGAWGMEGGPTSGWIMPGLDLGGKLRADASAGQTGVFVNGRQLHRADVTALSQFVQVQQGRWWVDGQGNFGAESGPTLGNLWALARASGKQPGKAWSLYANGGNNFVAGDENGCTYFNSRDMGNGTSTSWVSPGC